MSPGRKAALFVTGVAAAVALIAGSPADTPALPAIPAVSPPAGSLTFPNPDSAAFNFKGYIWPTDASRKITSSFAEYRSAHFHGGIDISTNGTTGHKVFAVQDGYVYRVRITPNGYGKMLYIRHPDGFISTYAHLRSFNGKIAEIARAEQYRAGSYEIDLIHDAPVVTVKKGEVIAYTGDTGFGPPHLHFEIRDSEMNPVNPLLGSAFRTPDNIPPSISRFMARPLGTGSAVNDAESPKVWSRFPRKDGTYRIPEKIRVRGDVGFSVETKDRSNGSGGRTGVYTLELLVDGQRAFHASLNAVPLAMTKQVYIHYDLPMILEGRGRFQKLYIEHGNELPLYGGTPGDGGVVRTGRLAEGDHPFTVRCTDIFGNTSTLTGTLLVSHPPEIVLADVSAGSIRLINGSHSPLDAVLVQGRTQFSPSWSGHTLPRSRLESSGDTVVVPVDTAPYDILKISARSEGGTWSEPLFHTNRKESGPAHKVFVDHAVEGDDLRITMTTPGIFTDTPAATIVEGERTIPVAMTLTDVSTAVGHYALPPRNAEPRTIRADAEVNRHPVTAEDRVDLYSIPPNRPGAFVSARAAFAVTYDSGAVFSPLHFRVEAREESGRTVYEFEPRDVLLNRGITVSLPAGKETGGKRGIYFRTNQGWVLMNTRLGPVPGMISGTLATTLGDVAVMEDDDAPTLGLLRVRSAGGKASVSFRYHDNLSGVDLERSTITIDGAVVIPEIDGEHRRVKYSGEERLKNGRHVVKIVLADRVGNESTAERTFTVR